MSIERIKAIKNSKFYKPLDFALYAVLLLIIVSSVVFFSIKNSSMKKIVGVDIVYKNEVAGSYTLAYGWKENEHTSEISFKVTKTENETLIIITTKNGYNELTVKNDTCYAYMTKADCTGEDCTKMKIEKSSDSIICVPHRVVVTPITDGELYIPPEIIV